MPTEKSEKPTPKEAAELFAQRIANIAPPLIADLPDVTKLLWELRCRIRQLNASIYTWRNERAEALQQLQKWLEYELANDPGE